MPLNLVLSLIIPAHNEAFELPQTLRSIFAAAQSLGQTFEILVINDASTDETASIARTMGARVVDVNLRQISRVRNAGARQARGQFFIFIDADTQLPEKTLAAAFAAMTTGAVGGGSRVRFDAGVGQTFQRIIRVFNFFYMGLCGWAAGCFIFAQRQAFETVGGFDETLFAAEEIALSHALKKQGRFVIVKEPVVTSARKARLYPLWWPLKILWRMLIDGRRVLRTREGLDLWYEGKREAKPTQKS